MFDDFRICCLWAAKCKLADFVKSFSLIAPQLLNGDTIQISLSLVSKWNVIEEIIFNKDNAKNIDKNSVNQRFEFNNEDLLEKPRILLDAFSDVSGGDTINFKINRKIEKRLYNDWLIERQNE